MFHGVMGLGKIPDVKRKIFNFFPIFIVLFGSLTIFPFLIMLFFFLSLIIFNNIFS